MPDTGWDLDKPPGDTWRVGCTYVVRATHGDIWAKMVVTVTSKTWDEGDSDYVYGFQIDTVLDGTPGFVDGWDSAANCQEAS